VPRVRRKYDVDKVCTAIVALRGLGFKVCKGAMVRSSRALQLSYKRSRLLMVSSARDVARAEGGESVPDKTYHGPFMPKPKPSTPTPAQADPMKRVVTFEDLREIVWEVMRRTGAPEAEIWDEVIEARTRAEGGRE